MKIKHGTNMDLVQKTKEIRALILKMNTVAKASHSGSALSVVDVLTILYFKVMNIDPMDPLLVDRDRFILSKGHASSALYATLATRGFFDKSLLEGFYIDGGYLPGHLDKDSVHGIEVSSGSLGHGLSIGIGMAISSKVDKLGSNIYVMLGDGELDEGSVWEALMFAPQQKLDNLTIIVDYNKLQGLGNTRDIVGLEPLSDKLRAFNWDVAEIDGHELEEIELAINRRVNSPKAIIAHTVKGKGVSFMENDFTWHYKSPNKEQLYQALRELS